jgi:hypothetical protein
MDAELRERLMNVIAEEMDTSWDCGPAVDGIMGEIEAAGYSIVKTDRLERLKRLGRIDRRNNMMCQLQDGDLE